MKTKYVDKFGAGHSSLIDETLIDPGAGPIVENLYLDGLKLKSSKASLVEENVGGFLVSYWFRGEFIKRRFPHYTQTVFDTNKLYFTNNNTAFYDFHDADGNTTTHELIEENPISFCASNPNFKASKCSSGLEEQLGALIDLDLKNEFTTTTPIIKYAAIIDSNENGANQAYKEDIGFVYNHYINADEGSKTKVTLYIDGQIMTEKEIEYKATFEVSPRKDFEQPKAFQAMFYDEWAPELAIGEHTAYVKVKSSSYSFTSKEYTFEILPGSVPYYDKQFSSHAAAIYRVSHFDHHDDVVINLQGNPDLFEPKIFINGARSENSSINGTTVTIDSQDLNDYLDESIGAVKIEIEETYRSDEPSKTPVELYIAIGTYDGPYETGVKGPSTGGDIMFPLGAVSHLAGASAKSDGLLIGSAKKTDEAVFQTLQARGEIAMNVGQHDFTSFDLKQEDNHFVVMLENQSIPGGLYDSFGFDYFAFFAVPVNLMAISVNQGTRAKLLPHIKKTGNNVSAQHPEDTGTGLFDHYAILNVDYDSLEETRMKNIYNLSPGITMSDSNPHFLTLDDAEQNARAKIYDLRPDEGSKISFDQQEESQKELLENAGRISYAITVVNELTRVESAPVYVIEFICLEDVVKLAIENIPNNRTIRIYRRGAFQDKDTANTKYQLVEELQFNGTDIEHLDNKNVTQLTHILTTENTLESQDDMNFSLVSKDKQRLFLTDGNTIRFSEPGEFTKFKTLGSITMSSDINGMIATTYGQVVFTKSGDIHNIRFVNGAPVVEQLAANIPLLTDTTLAIVNDNVFFLSYEGIMLLRRTSVVNITKHIVHKDRFYISHNPEDYSAAVLYNTYYLAEHQNNRMWSLDLDNRNRTIIHTNLDDTKNIVVMKGALYESTSNDLKKFFASNELLEINYLSGDLVAPFYDIEKEFVDLKYVFKGNFVISIYIDNVKVNEVAVSSDSLIADRFYFDVTKNKGIELAVGIVGKGIVKSLRVNFEEVNNG